MFVNKINSIINYRPIFKSRRYETNDNGYSGIRFNCLYDKKNENAYVEFYYLEKDEYSKSGYKISDYKAFHGAKVEDGGVFVDLDSKISPDIPVAYRFKIEDKNGKYVYYADDAGIKIKDDNTFVLLKRDGTRPVTNGSAVALMHDSNRIAEFDKQGNVVYDIEKQRAREQIEPNYATKMGGNIAGAMENIKYYKQMGITVVPHTPMWGCDTHTSHGYAGENPFQIAPSVGTPEQFRLYMREFFRNGLIYQHDATYTNESTFGNRFQNASKHYRENILDYYRFSMQGIQDYPVAVGLLPEDETNIRVKFVNSPVLTDGKPNRKYDSTKETYVQIYDKSLVDDTQSSDLEHLITKYEKAQNRTELKAGTYKDVANPDYFRCEPAMAEEAIKNAIKDGVDFETPDSVFYIMDCFPNFKLSQKSKGIVEWESMPGLASLAYIDTPQFKKSLELLSESEKEKVSKLREMAIYSNIDLAMQSSKYVFQFIKDSQIMEILDNFKDLTTKEDIVNAIKTLTKEEKLPKVAERLTDKAIENIVNGNYNFENVGENTRENSTLKAVMELPMEAVNFAPSTVGVLSSEYIANMAFTEEHLGKSRYELFMEGNPQIHNDWKNIYENTDELFTKYIKPFADKVIESLDNKLSEKLLHDGEYTEYGEYVIDLIGKEITKYAFLKSLTGDELLAKQLEAYKGSITYNYDDIREITSLKALGISESLDLKSQAKKLQSLIEDGMRALNNNDVDFLTEAFEKQLKGTSALTFRLAHAMYDVAGLGGNLRLDAAKNIIEINAIKTRNQTIAEGQDRINYIWSYIQKAVKSVNPHVNIAGELTDYGALFAVENGSKVDGYGSAEVRGHKYSKVPYLEGRFEGITSTYEYYLYSELLRIFSRDFEDGSYKDSKLMDKTREFINEKTLDHLNFRPTFFDNHDKPSAIHAMAIDMGLFYGVPDQNVRQIAIEVLMNMDNFDHTLDSKIKDNDYFKSVNFRAVAVSKLFRDIISYELSNDKYAEVIPYLKQATADLANGNYLNNSGKNINFYENAVFSITPEQNRLKNEYGTQDFRSVIKKILEQAKYIAKKDNKDINELFKNEDDIYAELFIKSTAPAVQKCLQMTSILTAIPGMPLVFLRDMLCGLGLEEKTWNVYLKMRGLTNWSELNSENEKLRNYIQNIFNSFSKILSIRSEEGAEPLNYGNPYVLKTDTHLEGIMMQDAHGGVTISLMDLGNTEKHHKVNYHEKLKGADSEFVEREGDDIVSIKPENPYVPIKRKDEVSHIVLESVGLGNSVMEKGEEFINLGNAADTARYVIDKIDNKLVLKNKVGSICLNGKTTVEGSGSRVMILKKVAAVSFRGKQINKQFNIVTNPYKQKESSVQGKNLFAIS